MTMKNMKCLARKLHFAYSICTDVFSLAFKTTKQKTATDSNYYGD